MKRRGLACALVIASAAFSGCAQLVVDGDGSRHLQGCMAVDLPPVEGAVGADSVRMRTLGLAVVRGEVIGASIVLGYSDTTLAVIRNNSLVLKAALLDPQGLQQGGGP